MQLEDSLSNVLAKVFRQHNRAYARALDPLGITTLHAHILVTLWLSGPMRVGALQRRLSLSSSTFTGAIDRMSKLGLLSRARDPEDGRAFLIVPAAWSASRRRRLERALFDVEAELFSALTKSEAATLGRSLGKVAAHMDDVERDLGW